MGKYSKPRIQHTDIPLINHDEAMIQPRATVVIGAGSPCQELIHLIRQQSGYKCIGILDPDRSLKGSFIEDTPILGWLSNIPQHVTCAVIGCPLHPHGFDRKSVYHILLRQGLILPVLRSDFSSPATDVMLPSGTVMLDQSRIESGASIGSNCLLEEHSTVCRCASLPEHTVLQKNRKWHCQQQEHKPVQDEKLQAVLATEDEPLQRIIERINWANMEIILVVNTEGGLIGTITDGDIRRGLLAGIDLTQPASIIMNRNPKTVPSGTNRNEMLRIMRELSIRHLPVVDAQKRPVILERLESIVDQISSSDAIVMAGGLGTRLRPLTDDTPKPLLPVGNRPILDHILTGLKKAGIDDVVLSVNYRGDQIREHVGNGAQHDLSVNYVTEKQRLGTAGALSLLSPRPSHPFLVLNGDLLTNLNYAKLLHFQQENDYSLVMCVRRYSTKIPYGVVDINPTGSITGLQEKPVHEHFINAGIYVLKPECLDLIPQGKFFDMTDLVNVLIQQNQSVGAFPIVEYWRDIGRPEDLRAASEDQLNHQRQKHSTDNAIPMEALL